MSIAAAGLIETTSVIPLRRRVREVAALVQDHRQLHLEREPAEEVDAASAYVIVCVMTGEPPPSWRMMPRVIGSAISSSRRKGWYASRSAELAEKGASSREIGPPHADGVVLSAGHEEPVEREGLRLRPRGAGRARTSRRPRRRPGPQSRKGELALVSARMRGSPAERPPSASCSGRSCFTSFRSAEALVDSAGGGRLPVRSATLPSARSARANRAPSSVRTIKRGYFGTTGRVGAQPARRYAAKRSRREPLLRRSMQGRANAFRSR